MSSGLDQAARDAIKRELRQVGLRATSARISVIAALRLLGRAVTHAELTEHLEDDGLDRVTVYRNLVALTEVEMVERFDVGDHVWRFALLGDREPSGVSRFVCTECGTVESLPKVELSVPRRGVPKSVRNKAVEVHLSGLCDDCN